MRLSFFAILSLASWVSSAPAPTYQNITNTQDPSGLTTYRVSYLKPLDGSEYSHAGVVALSTFNYKNFISMDFEESLEGPARSHLLKDKSNVLYSRDTQSSIYHDENDNKWYSIKFKEKPKRNQFKPVPMEKVIPVSGCLYGEPGQLAQTLDQGYAVSISASGGSSSTYSGSIGPVSLVAGTSRAVGAGYKFSGGFSCSVKDGYFVQLFIRPYEAEVPETVRIEIIPPSWRSRLMKKLSKSKSSLRPMKLLAAIQPNHICVYKRTQEELACGARSDYSLLV